MKWELNFQKLANPKMFLKIITWAFLDGYCSPFLYGFGCSTYSLYWINGSSSRVALSWKTKLIFFSFSFLIMLNGSCQILVHYFDRKTRNCFTHNKSSINAKKFWQKTKTIAPIPFLMYEVFENDDLYLDYLLQRLSRLITSEIN